jgi:O-antigen/teichoic acid export membrane protein
MKGALMIFVGCAILAVCGLLVSAKHEPFGAAIAVFFGLAAVALPICYAIIHAAKLRKEEKS